MKRKIFVAFALVMLVSTSTWAASGEVFSLMGGYVAPTCAVATTDTSALLNTAFNAACASPAVDWTRVRAVLIQAPAGTNPAVISVGTAAVVSGATQVGYTLSAGSSVRFVGNDFAKRLYIISAGAGAAARIQVTVEY